MALTKQAKALLDMVYRVGAPRFHELSVAQARGSFRKMQFAFGTERQAVASTTEIPISRGDGSALLARLYRPLGVGTHDILPLVVYFHGGGWCVGDIQSYDSFCRELANRSGCSLLSVDYRLAPEHPFPAAVDDALIATEWAWHNARSLGIDPHRISLAGDSAGGNLAVVAALSVRDRRSVPLRFLVLIYPSTDMFSTRASHRSFGHGFMLDRESLEWFRDRYLRDCDRDDWRISPLRAESLANLPPILLVTAECDPLIDDCEAFRERVQSEGGEVERIHVDGMIHGFITWGKYFQEAETTINQVAVRLRCALT